MNADRLGPRREPQCRCEWDGSRCPNAATAEDGLCDWCAPQGARSRDQLVRNPNAIIMAHGEVTLGGGGERHVNTRRTPDACWLPGSGRTLSCIRRR